MKPEIHFLPYEALPEIARGNGIVNHVIASRKIGARTIHTGLSRLPVGVPAPPHSHNAEEQVTVLEGTERIRLGDREQVCGPLDSTFISAGVEHELVNVGDAPALVLVVYGSPDVNRTFTATGQTVEIGSDGDRFTA
ncbi:cupin domain-containing protein [Aquabacterium sp. OR-4]|uniref:cupin domain-containing protein n=1 Tax=Aquabacterium sp. OR-4 TaxID=2978127 RepID=UPI0028C5494D|nr:cupin domain-containing protein [Aquabacterium sp. OR-4]MDT7839064.1 cupin domain-containing protein [Aquabacterium sp. OR-4]